MGLVEAFVRNPVKIAVGVILLVLFGAIAYVRMPMQLTPEVQTPTITVETRWSGASPQEIEREIVEEQEEQLKAVEGVVKLSSECMDSQGKITLEFGVGTIMSEALLKVNARLSQVPAYPEEADEPVINTVNSADQPIAWFILRDKVANDSELEAFANKHPELRETLQPAINAGSAALRLKRIRSLAGEHAEIASLIPPKRDISKLQLFVEDTIEARFERVAGVANSNVLGGREREVQITIRPADLASRGLSLGQVRQALLARNTDVSAGDYWEGKRRYVVRTLGRFRSLDEIRSVLVARTENGDVTLADVADVALGHKKPTGMVRSFGSNVIAINCQRTSTANVMTVMDGLKEARIELNKGPLAERQLELDQVYDETDYIESAVGLVRSNLLLGAVLTILVLLLFLRSLRSTLVIALAIPTSLIGTFLLLQLMGRSLNVISLAGLAFAIGMLVDNAVVVLENIYRRYQSGERRFVAATKGTHEVWGAVVASTLTTLAVFVPILFVKEEAGQLFKDIALAISCSVGLSLVVSVTLIPVLTSRILPRHTVGERKDSAITRFFNMLLWPIDVVARGFAGGIVAFHGWLQEGLFRQLGLVIAIAAGTWLAYGKLIPQVEYLPNGNRNLAIGVVLPPPGYNIDRLVAMGEQVEEKLRPYWDVDWANDEALKKLPFPPIEHFFFVVRGRQVFLGARALDPLRAGELVPLIRMATSGIPGTFSFASQTSLFQRGLTAGRSIDIEITGPKLERLVGIGGQIMGMGRGAIPGAQLRPVPSLDLSNPEVHIRPRFDRAAELGVNVQQLGYAVNSLVDGAYAGDYDDEGDRIDLTIRGEVELASRLEDLEELPLATPSGEIVLLRALADISLASGPEQINRRERERSITIAVSPPEEISLEEAIELIESKIIAPMKAQGAIGGQYRVQLAGTADKLRATWSALFYNVLLAILITYLLMAALFESWLYPFVIILSVPLGAVGGLFGLYLLNKLPNVIQPLDVLTMIGFVILIGTVVNNAILIVHQSLQGIRNDGLSPGDAVLASVRSRLRPIFMTTTTTVFGLMPLVLMPGAGSELYRGLGSVLLGGLVVSTIVTIFLVPAMFRLVLSVQQGLARLLGLGPSKPTAPNGTQP